MQRIVVTGTSLAVDALPEAVPWLELVGALRAAGATSICPSLQAAEDMGIVSARDRRILSAEDVFGICAAEMACRDAGLATAAVANDHRTGCIVVSAGKHTVAGELANYRRKFISADGVFDLRTMREAVAGGGVHIDPSTLLHGLENNVLWWICRYRGMGGVNLQINQSVSPSCLALREAWELICEGTCDRVLVGGQQTRAQSLPHAPDTPVLAGIASFAVLESDDAARARSARIYGEFSVQASEGGRTKGHRAGGKLDAAPAIAPLLGLFVGAHLGRGEHGITLGAADLLPGHRPQMVFARSALERTHVRT